MSMDNNTQTHDEEHIHTDSVGGRKDKQQPIDQTSFRECPMCIMHDYSQASVYTTKYAWNACKDIRLCNKRKPKLSFINAHSLTHCNSSMCSALDQCTYARWSLHGLCFHRRNENTCTTVLLAHFQRVTIHSIALDLVPKVSNYMKYYKVHAQVQVQQ